MDEQLEKLINIPGVEGVFVFNNRGKTMLHLLKRNVEDSIIEEIGQHVIQLFFVNKMVNLNEFNNMELSFDKGSLVIYHFDYYTIVIWASRSVQMSIIRLNSSVVISALEKDGKFKKMVKKNKIDANYLMKEEYLDQTDLLLISKLQ